MRTDVAAMRDTSEHNSGFIVVKPTNISKRLYRMITSRKSTTAGDQTAFNRAVQVMIKQNMGLNITSLDRNRFMNGRAYFGKSQRWLASHRQKCVRKKDKTCAVVVHNNCIISKAVKIYRFREHLMWMYDGDDQYYTSNTRLYLTYINQQKYLFRAGRSGDKPAVAKQSELSALKTAMTIGYILNRTVILPKFHNGSESTERLLSDVLPIRRFDEYLSGHYRESSFLFHPKVPANVKSGLSEQVLTAKFDNNSFSAPPRVFSAVDIFRHFSNLRDRVLVFRDLYDVYVELKNSTQDITFMNKLRRAFPGRDYRQFTEFS